MSAVCSKPAVSIVMPIYNASRTLRSSIESVLGQSFRDFELIAINDGSIDDSAAVLRSFHDSRIRIIEHHANRGVVAVLNEGLSEARSEFIARHDADDISFPNRLALQHKILKSESQTVAIGAALRLISDDGSALGTWYYPQNALLSRWQLLFKTPVAHSVVMYRLSAVLSVGGYFEQYKYAEDYDLWSRLIAAGDIKSIRSPLLRYRLGVEGVSRAKANEQHLTHLRIAARNMSFLLGREAPSVAVRVLATGIDVNENLLPYADFGLAAATLSVLFRRFLVRESNPEEYRSVCADCSDRYVRMVRLLPVRNRLRAIRDLRRVADKATFNLFNAALALTRFT